MTIQIRSFENRSDEEYLVFSKYVLNVISVELTLFASVNTHVHTFREINTTELNFLDSMISERFQYLLEGC